MNRERARELLPIIETYANGGDIQFQDGDGWSDVGDGHGIAADCLEDGGLEYRIKPKAREFYMYMPPSWKTGDQVYVCRVENEAAAKAGYIKVREVLDEDL